MEQSDVNRAAALLAGGDVTCALCKGDNITYTSTKRGVQFLMELLDAGTELTGFSAADKVVGKATAMLLLLHGITAVHAGVLSDAAEALLRENGVPTSFDTRTERIINRAGTGMCPMEQAVWALDDPKDAPAAIRQAMARLRTGK